MVINKTKANRN